ncbi:MAG: sigma-70 family RNA polymerase sigma factor [Eubacterium sp.]|nr:sigma-70 family RNA polymerase sigma factor [Eubacterium sp.]
MFCEKCGEEIREGQNYCPKCGFRIGDLVQESVDSSSNNREIENLVNRFKSGDESAYQELYNRTYQRNRYVALKIVHSDAEADDVLQDAYLKVYTKIDQYIYTGESSFASWTSKIVNNTAINHLRGKQPMLFSEMETDDGEEFQLELEDDKIEFQPEFSYDKKETANLVREIVDTLPDDQRASVMMYYFEEMSVKDIAAECECSENTVKSRLNYARKSMLTRADALKKKGLLSGAITMAGLIALLRSKEAFAAEATTNCATTLANILSEAHSGVSGSTELGTACMQSTGVPEMTVGSETASTGVTGAALGLKVTIGVVCSAVAISIGTVFFINRLPDKDTVISVETPVPYEEPTAEPTPESTIEPTPEPTPKPTYKEMYKEYYKNLKGIITVDGFSQQRFKFGRFEQIDFPAKKFSEYKLCDIDEDGIPEMIMRYVHKRKKPSQSKTLAMICTIKNDEVVPIFGVEGQVEWPIVQMTKHRICFEDGALSPEDAYRGSMTSDQWARHVYCQMSSGRIIMDRCYLSDRTVSWGQFGGRVPQWKRIDKKNNKWVIIEDGEVFDYYTKCSIKTIFGMETNYEK